jgi:hypothetical protein
VYSLGTLFVSGIYINTLHKGDNDDDDDNNNNTHSRQLKNKYHVLWNKLAYSTKIQYKYTYLNDTIFNE